MSYYGEVGYYAGGGDYKGGVVRREEWVWLNKHDMLCLFCYSKAGIKKHYSIFLFLIII